MKHEHILSIRSASRMDIEEDAKWYYKCSCGAGGAGWASWDEARYEGDKHIALTPVEER